MSAVVRSVFILLMMMQVLVMVTACTENDDQALFNAVASAELASIRNDLELYRSLAAEESSNEELSLKVAQSILQHVLLIRTADPKIESFRGEPLETICLLTEPDTRKILNEAGNLQLASLAHMYLESIELEVRKKIEEYQKTMKGKGCYLTPEL
ncbi:MAG: hypothetical protein JMN25_17630 [gamma proteobacterium endosymbiont of Lamellibrachia anaximandri]|nr:hypothetical protein [gamma proteobacterium endosymbiont of Lamellibrachia anaximandri]